MLYTHYDDVPRDVWPAKYFSVFEIACHGTGELLINHELLDKLDVLRFRLGRALVVSSSYRSKYFNASVGGAPRSYHLRAMAADLPLAGHDKSELIDLAKQVGFTGFGISYISFIHIDIGRSRSW
jgi:uncharacterized protein YcbK (DUF882 family)